MNKHDGKYDLHLTVIDCSGVSVEWYEGVIWANTDKDARHAAARVSAMEGAVAWRLSSKDGRTLTSKVVES